ncbi:nucleotidyl cyclase domain-containing protein [Paraburkholderia sediminicola]|uniref:hypothetical protein n=1 Tax=Paraburkholderia sediminicola TaxID=458836 RepID=UPI0038B89434
MQLAYSNDRLSSRMSVDPSATGEPEVESSVIEWLLHDDQVMRECFTHAAEILKSVTGAAITAITLLDEEHQHYRAEVGMAMPLVTRALAGRPCGARAEPVALEDTLEALRQGVEDLAIEHRASPLGMVTVSVGASLTRMTEGSRLAHREGFASADRALYRSKHEGRNLVTMA